MPERVSVAMAEFAGEMREGLLALAVGAGLQVMAAFMEADVTAVAGPKGATTRRARRCATATARVGDPGWAPGPGEPAAGARGRRLRRAAGGLL